MFSKKLWKYKNAAPKLPKKEQTLFDVPIGSLMISNGNYIASSCKFMSFNVKLGGSGSVAVCPLGATGRRDRTMPYVHAHKDFVSDMDFSPFDDCMLVTGSYGGEVKVWKIPEDGLTETLDTPVGVVNPTIADRRVENVAFNPAAENVLALALHDMVEIADLTTCSIKHGISGEGDKPLQSMIWKDDGSLLITTCKDGQMRVFDPRMDTVAAEWEGLDCNRESRCLWLGDTSNVLSAGFDASSRDRAVAVWDIRNCTEKLHYHKQDRGHGALMPFYDADTNMLFVCGKGDCFLMFYEVSSASPHLKAVSRENIEMQTVGMVTVPKRALNLMDCEVNRLLQLTKSSIVPLSYIVPRKSYIDFHADVYPDTPCGLPSMTAADWLAGKNEPVKKMVLQPSEEHMRQRRKPPAVKVEATAGADPPQAQTKAPEVKPQTVTLQPSKASMEAPAVDFRLSPKVQAKATTKGGKFSAARTSKYRYFTGKPCHKTLRLDNLRKLNGSLPGESDGIQAHKDLVAIPLSGPGGQVAVLKLSTPGRLPDEGPPVLQNSSTVLDFAMDPFDEHNIAVACEDGHIRIWRVPEDGLEETLTTPQHDLRGHQSRVSILRYHPTARGVLASAAHDCCIKVWDIENEDDAITLEEHPELIIAMAWHPLGHLIATACKDKCLRVFDPRTSTAAMRTGDSLPGNRGARLAWAGHDAEYLLMAGFSQMSRRGVGLFNSADLSLVQMVELDSSPAVFTMTYDADTNVVLLVAKGDQSVRAFEIQPEHESAPMFALSDCKCADLIQGLSCLQKSACDVKEVEFLRGVRTSKTYVEWLSFCVPRVKKHLFQDDVFPDTRLSWQPALLSGDWFSGSNAIQETISLRPEGMENVTKTVANVRVTKKYESSAELTAVSSAEEKKNKLIDAMMDNVNDGTGATLPQDAMQGVAEEEWDD